MMKNSCEVAFSLSRRLWLTRGNEAKQSGISPNRVGTLSPRKPRSYLRQMHAVWLQRCQHYKVISHQDQITPLSGSYGTIWTDQQIKDAISFIDDKRTRATLKKLLQHFIDTEGFPPISAATSWKYLGGQLITFKDAAAHNRPLNSPDAELGREGSRTERTLLEILENAMQNATMVKVEELYDHFLAFFSQILAEQNVWIKRRLAMKLFVHACFISNFAECPDDSRFAPSHRDWG